MTRAHRRNRSPELDLDWDESGINGQGESAMFSWHFLRTALRRRRGPVLLTALVGLVLSAIWLVIAPGQHQASVVLVMAHPPGSDHQKAQATDARLASARPVALATVRALGLRDRAEYFAKSVRATPTTGDVLTLTLTASSDRQALRRLSALTTEYLRFRSQQLMAQSGLQIRGWNSQIEALRKQADDLSRQIDALGTDQGDRRAELITVRAKLMQQVGVLQQAVEDSALTTAALVAGSRVIDQVAALPAGGKRRIVLGMLPGLIGGAALGAGMLLFTAVTSDRLRRRLDVATALGLPVLTSVGRIRPMPTAFRMLPWMRRWDRQRTVDRTRVADVIQAALPEPGLGQWLVVGCVDNADEIAYGVVAAAQNLLQGGYVVHLIDLTMGGRLASAVTAMPVRHAPGQLTVSQPRVMAALASDLSDIQTIGTEPGQEYPWRAEDIFITLGELSPDLSTDHLSSWADRVVLAVTAGRSTAERLRTAAERIRSADMEIRSTVLLRAEPADESSGYGPEQVGVSPGGVQLSPV